MAVEIIVTIVGHPADGKMTIAKLIRDALHEKLFETEVIDPDINNPEMYVEDKIRAVRSKSPKIRIVTQQLNRSVVRS